MLAKDIRVGGVYVAKVSNKLTRVRVDEIREQPGFRAPLYSGRRSSNSTTRYDCTNLATGRQVTFRSAQKFRGTIHPIAQQIQDQIDTEAREAFVQDATGQTT